MEILVKGKVNLPELMYVCPECNTTFKIDPRDDYKYSSYIQYNEIDYYVSINCPVCGKLLRKAISADDAERWRK